MGKRSLLCFLLLGLLFFSSVCAEAPAVMTERETADRLEQEFGIRILIGDEVTEVPSDDFVVHPAGEYINILMEMLSLTETEQALKILEETLSVYPEGFFRRYAKPLVFCLAGEITDPEWVPQSVTSGFCHEEEDCIYMFLDIRFMFPECIQDFLMAVFHACGVGIHTQDTRSGKPRLHFLFQFLRAVPV